MAHTFKPAQIELIGSSLNKPIRTIPELIQYNAENNEDTLFCQQALTSVDTENGRADDDVASRQLTVTMRQLRDAVWRCSERLRSDLGLLDSSFGNSATSGLTQKRAVVALFMDSDLSILVHLFALLALGVPVG